MRLLDGETVEPLTWRHIRAWGGSLAYTDDALAATPMVGWVMRNGYGRMIALGGVVWWDSVPIGMFDMRPSYREAMTLSRSLRVQRLTRQVLAAVSAVEPVIYAWIDPDIPRAEAWAMRFGFKPRDEKEGVWVRGVDAVGSQNCIGGGDGADGGRNDPAGQRGGSCGPGAICAGVDARQTAT